jgi:hydroxymethylglutaryl-CoA lyase
MGGYPRVVITEEAMREGMQIERADIPLAEKIRLLDALSETGLRDIVVGSFVSPKWTPQMACIEELVRGFHPKPGVRYHAVALNERGVERLREFVPPLTAPRRGFQTIAHMCDVFVRRNKNRSQAEEIAAWPKTVAAAREHGALEAGIGINAAWGSNWVGEFTQEQRMHMLLRQAALWNEAGIKVTRVSLGDPMGWNMPDQVERQLVAIKEQWPDVHDFNLHLHDTRGVALTSAYVALRVLEAGDTLRLQPALGGLGGCPYCGNGRGAGVIATEDLVHLLEGLGIPTGVDLDRLIEAVWIAEEVVGHPLWGHVSKTGPRPRYDRLYAMDMPFIETHEQAKHFIKGRAVYEGALAPWKEPITSFQRPDGGRPANGHAPDDESRLAESVPGGSGGPGGRQ